MKKILTCFLTLVTISILLNSCFNEDQNVSSDRNVPSRLLQDVRNWHHQQTNKAGLLQQNNEKRQILTPKFEEASIKTFTGGSILYTPAMDFDLKSNTTKLLRGFIFSIQRNEIISGRIVEIYGAPDYISINQNELLRMYVDGHLGDFSGFIVTYDVNYNYVDGQVYKNGHRIGARPALGYKVMDDHDKISSGRTLDGDWYHVYGVTYYSDGSQDWDYFYSYCVGCGGGGAENPGGGYSGPGSETPAYLPGDTYALQMFEQDYKAHMSASELQIYNNMSRYQQVSYLMNAQEAISIAEWLYPGDQLNTQADAFRHAYFSYLNVMYLGLSLAESLGNAHENYAGNNPTQMAMDLYNNQVGRDAADISIFSITDHIQDLIESGELRIIVDGVLGPSNN